MMHENIKTVYAVFFIDASICEVVVMGGTHTHTQNTQTHTHTHTHTQQTDKHTHTHTHTHIYYLCICSDDRWSTFLCGYIWELSTNVVHFPTPIP